MSAAAPSKDEVLLVLRSVLSEHFDVRAEQVVPSAHLVEDLDLDSIDWIDLAVRLEMQTGQKLDEAEVASLRTVEDVVDVVHRRLGAARSSTA